MGEPMSNFQLYIFAGLAWTAFCLMIMDPYPGKRIPFLIATALSVLFWPAFLLVAVRGAYRTIRNRRQ